jgi:gamma-glutamyltranspeptidase / glutathione hydrolase
MQAQGHVQVLVNMIDFGLNVQAAGDMSRAMHTGSATPTGLPAEGSGTVNVERGIPTETIEQLRAKGHSVTPTPRSGTYGGYQGILIDWETGVLHGATESRKDGVAAGY